MTNSLRRLFCRHAYKETNKEYLRTRITSYSGIVGTKKAYYLVSYKCLICRKEKVVEEVFSTTVKL